jgi:mutator protein MutT
MAEVLPGLNEVACGLLVREGRVLFVHRNPARAWAPNCWDAPGGHIEQGESDLEALARELREELGIELCPADTRLVARLKGADFDARVFLVGSWSGEPENKAPEEHDDIAWLDEDTLARLTLADPDLLPIIAAVLRDNAGAGK